MVAATLYLVLVALFVVNTPVSVGVSVGQAVSVCVAIIPSACAPAEEAHYVLVSIVIADILVCCFDSAVLVLHEAEFASFFVVLQVTR